MRLLVMLLVFALAMASASWLAARRWALVSQRETVRLVAAARAPSLPFDPVQLEGLPPPVARYLGLALREGQPLVQVARLRQRGTFLLRPRPDGWRAFEARSVATADPPGFQWDARIDVAPGVRALVRDGYIDGGGSMSASLAGLVPLVDVRGTPEVATGALMRYLAEAAWYPTVLLPGQGVTWAPLDSSAARATLTVGSTTVALDFHFGPDGLVSEVYAPDRPREVRGRWLPTPWRGRWLRYSRLGGMLIPTAAEVEWILSDGPQPYWRGEIVEARFENAPAAGASTR